MARAPGPADRTVIRPVLKRLPGAIPECSGHALSGHAAARQPITLTSRATHAIAIVIQPLRLPPVLVAAAAPHRRPRG
jgi:hypothetical protein